MSLSYNLFFSHEDAESNIQVRTPMRSLSRLNLIHFQALPETMIVHDEHQALYQGDRVDAWLWIVSQIDESHPLFLSFESLFKPLFSNSFFEQQMSAIDRTYGNTPAQRIGWLWRKIHQQDLSSLIMERLNQPYECEGTILDEVFSWVALYIDPRDLHNDPLWMAWWTSPNGARKNGGAKVLENLCLAGQIQPIPTFIRQTSDLSVMFFETMDWNTIVARQIFAGVSALAQHLGCDMPKLIRDKGLVPKIGVSLLTQPTRWDKILSPWCVERHEHMVTTSTQWFVHNLMRNRNFLFFEDDFQNQWKELQRRGLAPSVRLNDLQQQLSDAMGMDVRTTEIPYQLRPEPTLTIAASIIERNVLTDAVNNVASKGENAPISRRKM